MESDGKALGVGEIAPDFELPDSAGVPRRLSEFVAADPRILIFYRGHW
jgi:thioredoxin-dependent peroxiredoxin